MADNPNFLLPDVHVPTEDDGTGRRVVDTTTLSKNFYNEVSFGNLPNYSHVHIVGATLATTVLRVISQTGLYPTPTTAQPLEVVSTSAEDNAAGTGAREITVIGLDTSWNRIVQTVVPTGLTPAPLTTNLIRLLKWYVSASGTYATSTTGSHAGTLSMQISPAGTVWATIPILPFALGESQIAAYTIPTGYTGRILGKIIYTATPVVADLYFFQRDNADDVTAPYTGAMRLIEKQIGVKGGFDHHFVIPKGEFTGPCDIGFMAQVSASTADISAEFELLLKLN